MSLKNSRLRLASAALVVALCGLATATATGPATAATEAGAREQTSFAPSGFVDLPAGPLPADGERHAFTVGYRNDGPTDRTVAPQLLVVSPDGGPFLDPADVEVERRTAHGCWEAVEVGTQTGTLFTDLAKARRTLHPGETLTQVYRVTVADPQVKATVAPRVALYG
ncbi:hypothetical protein [Streptomyces lanatus]|uniref:Signal peptide protein n=1 Tax=Streptomyces lanatus TaxID=66900 RepID=A0ABV1XRS7_9ACTN|nr:hypothetical protein [Streptomyces lanatus]GHH04686.1 hypothetical protein GCM10018780_35400 [Streptomyces lanatus]